MSSNIKIQKTCQLCGETFTAKTTVTKFCSDKCAKRAYKIRKRNEKVEKAVEEEKENGFFNPLVNQKEFLSINETAQLIGASRRTIYRLLKRGDLNAGKVGNRTIIKRTEIDKLFK